MEKNGYLSLSLILGLILSSCAGVLGPGIQQEPVDQELDFEESHLEISPQADAGSGELDSVSLSFPVVDTGQDHCYSDQSGIPCPDAEGAYFGQDAQYQGLQPSYQDNGDGTVLDLNTGLMWQQNPDLAQKSTYQEALVGAESLTLAGYDDWRLPTIKELYSLIDFKGSASQNTPYLDSDFFQFVYGDQDAGERQIDAQYWSSTSYVGTTMNGNFTVFGVNFADGRIKGYPAEGANGREMKAFVRYVRGNPDYGKNHFEDNGNGTISDLATGLVWQQADSGAALDWEAALNYCENLSLDSREDWRLPNAKELQSIVDYSRSPQTSGSAAIDPAFLVTEVESWYWTSTTHLDTSPANAVYIAFGQAYGLPDGVLMDVHGAGAQRSDPKSGDPSAYAAGRGTEGQDDQVRINNFARCVRGGVSGDILSGGEVDEFSGISGSMGNGTSAAVDPPREAITACEQLPAGATCSFLAPKRAITGTCQGVGSGVEACVPDTPPER